MDELLHHCLQELAFDGDLGSDVSRLRDFVIDFYAHAGALHTQNVDSAFCGFVWSLVVQQPTVLVGLIPEGTTTEVWVAPQTSAQRKAKARGEAQATTERLKLESIPDPKTTSLEILRSSYGDRLRLAAEPNTIFAALTGSHIRSSKLSPMVYSALQIITRGRDTGVTVVELGKQSGYDQRTCFYLVGQLTDLDLVVKVRRGGVGTHFCIHKYFYERDSSWNAIRDEEIQAENIHAKQQDPEQDLLNDNVPPEESHQINFTPIDARHLSSLPLVSARVIKLLKASRNYIHACSNILLTLGFSNPTKQDRRFFQSRIREMIQQGIIEKVIVPSNKKKTNAPVKCFRLIEHDSSTPSDGLVLPDPDDDMDDAALAISHSEVKLNTTIHKQIVDLLEDSGMTGMTLSELSSVLCDFDKRTIELILTRADKCPPPSHLTDLHVVGIMETSGRERHHRYFTVRNYHKLITSEKLDNTVASHNGMDLENVGGFTDLAHNSFYETVGELANHADAFKSDENLVASKRKQHTGKNPVLPDGSVKRGRPRKSRPTTVDASGSPQPRGTKRKREEEEEALFITLNDRPNKRALISKTIQDVPKPAARRRGRPAKSKTASLQESKATLDEDNHSFGVQVHPHEKDLTPARIPPSTGMLSTAAEIDYITPEHMNSQPDHVHDPPSSSIPLHSANKGSLISSSFNPALDPRTIATDDSPLENATTLFRGRNIAGLESSVEVSISNPDLQSPLSSGHLGDANLANSSNVFIHNAPVPSALVTRVNVSHLRRENEFLKLVENAGGIMGIQTKVFHEDHLNLLRELSKAGEPTSSPVGTRTDKRTMVSTFDSLERKGRIKQLKTTITAYNSINRPFSIVYLPQTTEAQLNAYLLELPRASQPTASQLDSFVKIDQPLDYEAPQSSRGQRPLQLLQMEHPGNDKKEKWSQNYYRAEQLLGHDDMAIRDILLAERSTLNQIYGYLMGRAMRCRQLHLHILQLFESRSTFSHIVSHAKRIVDISLFFYDLPLGLYCSLVSPPSYDEGLTAFYNQAGGRNTLVRNLPENLQITLQVGRSRARSRLLEILEMLRSLNLVTPLQASASPNPFITCPPTADRPTQYDVASLEGWTSNSSMSAPTYWLFGEDAPIYLWATSDTQPPFWKNMSTSSYQDGVVYWQDVQEACTNPNIEVVSRETGRLDWSRSTNTAKSFRRPIAWKSGYSLSWYQMQYLNQFIDSFGSTPLSASTAEERVSLLDRICWVTHAPQGVIEEYYSANGERLGQYLEGLRQRAKKDKRHPEESRFSLARKSAEARLEREREWSSLISKIYSNTLPPPAAVRIERIRVQFLQGGSIKTIDKWQKEIQTALHEANLASTTKGLKISSFAQQPHLKPALPGPPSLAVLPVGLVDPSIHGSIQDLIQLQGPPIQHDLKRKRKKDSTGDNNGQKKNIRRQRFQWNPDFDELARDASVIIRARCRSLSRLDWAAFEQVFPAVPRNTVRQRLSHIKEWAGNETYLLRLEEAWYEMWMRHRGSPLLPDEDHESASAFDLIKHIEFLRANMDKNALRVGKTHKNEVAKTVISSTAHQILEEFEIARREQPLPLWDFMWNSAIEEGREKRLKRHVFSRYPEGPSSPPELDVIVVAESAVKMVMGTPPERYGSEHASLLLQSRGGDDISTATRNLLSLGVLSKLQRDPKKHKPGRQLKISETNQSAIGGNIARDTFQDAVLLLDEMDVTDSNWHEWPLTATDGDCAALIQLVSDDQVNFRVDTSSPQAARPTLDWNSKKAGALADDDQIETAISVQYNISIENQDIDESLLMSEGFGPSPEVGDNINMEKHGITVDSSPACCRLNSVRGLVDCSACLSEACTMLCSSLDAKTSDVVKKLLDLVGQAKESGIKKADLPMFVSGFTHIALSNLLDQMVRADIPQIHWTGYDSVVLVSAGYVAKWSVVVAQDPLVHVFPRRWLDIKGDKVADFWQAALRAVIGLIIFRPGIAQSEIRWRLRLAYDRQELNEVLQHLSEEGYLRTRYGETSGDMFYPYDESEETHAYWFIGDRHWYQA